MEVSTILCFMFADTAFSLGTAELQKTKHWWFEMTGICQKLLQVMMSLKQHCSIIDVARAFTQGSKMWKI